MPNSKSCKDRAGNCKEHVDFSEDKGNIDDEHTHVQTCSEKVTVVKEYLLPAIAVTAVVMMQEKHVSRTLQRRESQWR